MAAGRGELTDAQNTSYLEWLKTQKNTVKFDLDAAPEALLKALTEVEKLSANQLRNIYARLNGVQSVDELMTAPVSSVKAFADVMVALIGNKKEPRFEFLFAGRWYPVLLDAEYSSGMWGTSASIGGNAIVVSNTISVRAYITSHDFNDEMGVPDAKRPLDILADYNIRPLQQDLEELNRLNGAAIKLNSQTGTVLHALGSGVVFNGSNYGTRYFVMPIGSDLSPTKVVVDAELELDTRNSYYGGNQAYPLPFVRVFSLTQKQFVGVDIRDLREYRFDEDAINRLVLPDAMRQLLTTVFGAKVDRLFKDVVQGKSGGLAILATGSPGTGKTLTAEVFAEYTRRPMYSLEMGELGTKMQDVEQSLQKIFLRAARWNAILLFDEADIFMAERGNDLERSSIVGVFLRVLDYYPGILFLTSNRPTVMDTAFLSRVSLHLQYPDHDTESRTKVWTSILKAAKLKIKGGLDGLPSLEMNGRNIRNLARLVKIFYPGTVEEDTGDEGVSTVTAAQVKAIAAFTPLQTLNKQH